MYRGLRPRQNKFVNNGTSNSPLCTQIFEVGIRLFAQSQYNVTRVVSSKVSGT